MAGFWEPLSCISFGFVHHSTESLTESLRPQRRASWNGWKLCFRIVEINLGKVFPQMGKLPENVYISS